MKKHNSHVWVPCLAADQGGARVEASLVQDLASGIVCSPCGLILRVAKHIEAQKPDMFDPSV